MDGGREGRKEGREGGRKEERERGREGGRKRKRIEGKNKRRIIIISYINLLSLHIYFSSVSTTVC